ncbi:MAG: redox-sensing transcriptional repressor Rex [Oscillospiraceae bacterium]|nr:redox-sensing transcriptional repressor Rex [Oscillospiraceae bacterium]
MKENRISDNVIRRLPRYLRALTELEERGEEKVSSSELGRLLGLTASQIRQDLNCFGGFGLQGYGYNVPTLRVAISGILGMNRGYRAVLVGVGNIGRALIERFQFNDWGFTLQCAFDIDPAVVGTSQRGIPVLDSSALPEYLRENRVDAAVLAVPAQEAKEVAALLRRCGVEAIWNFTNVDVQPPGSDVIVENVHFSDSLLALSYFLTEKREGQKSAVEQNG